MKNKIFDIVFKIVNFVFTLLIQLKERIEKKIDKWVEDEIPPIAENNTNINNYRLIRLHNEMCELVYKFMEENDIPDAYNISFGIDELQSLKKYGTSCPMCDTYMTIFDKNKKSLVTSM